MLERTTDRVVFIGVTTAGSVVPRVFPAWMDVLGRQAALTCVDVPLNSPAAAYRQIVSELTGNPHVVGAVITSHKRALYESASDLLRSVSPDAQHFGETSVLVRQPGGLSGELVEPISMAKTLADLGRSRPVTRPDADVVVFGAGGGTATTLLACITSEKWPADAVPRRMLLVDVSEEALERARDVVDSGSRRVPVVTVLSSEAMSLDSLGDVPPGSLFVNATGLGKDRPGSPVLIPASWPRDSLVWDLNYRGQLVMLESAAAAEHVTAIDGWRLFVRGWSESLGVLFGRPLTLDQIAAVDAEARRAKTVQR